MCNERPARFEQGCPFNALSAASALVFSLTAMGLVFFTRSRGRHHWHRLHVQRKTKPLTLLAYHEFCLTTADIFSSWDDVDAENEHFIEVLGNVWV
ncbi:hypothetical protein ACJIZ3_003687 [Penstemon smallii]|uniref:Uncharacterized protein n=1 Tax=Penstemon smallii TaxID=265156 RepID=A0ABD3U9X2_9LAMI